MADDPQSVSQDDPSVEIRAKPVFKLVGKYILGNVLGNGASSKVKEGIDKDSARRVAVKIINLKWMKKKSQQDSLKREVQILKRLHKLDHVIGLIECLQNKEKDKFYIVIELASYGSLHELIALQPKLKLEEDVARCFFWQLTEGLEECHSRGIVHRDIKPANLLLNCNGKLKLSDFGVAEELERYSHTDTCFKVHGSPAFQPPEVVSGEEHSGPKTDLWAAGITLYYMLTGQTPFNGQSLQELVANIRKAEFDVPSDVDATVANLLQLILAREESARPPLSDIKKNVWVEKGAHVKMQPLQTKFTSAFLAESEEWQSMMEDDDEDTSTKPVDINKDGGCFLM